MNAGFYFKQAWYNIRTDKTYSAVFILGTSMSVALIMAFLSIASLKFANTYPERHRDRTMTVNHARLTVGNGNMESTISPKFVETFIEGIPGIEEISTVYSGLFITSLSFTTEDGELAFKASPLFVDTDFWKVFDFQTVEGRLFTENGTSPSAPEIVISKSTAMRVFNRTDVIGEIIFLRRTPMKICGVVRDVPVTAGSTCADIYIPISVAESWPEESFFDENPGGIFGDHMAYILAKDRKYLNSIKEEVNARVQRYNESNPDKYVLDCYGAPFTTLELFLYDTGNDSGDLAVISLCSILLIMAIPLFNLSGMVTSRIENRFEEFGLRKSFGARPGNILWQVIWENLLMTSAGGIIGVIGSFLIITALSPRLNGILGNFFAVNPISETMPLRELIRTDLILPLIALILTLNIFSAIIPARKAIRRPIAESLAQKQ
ncbi:MAG TPA: ABC transporter permease [Candidatus Coprenecus stercoripullorum]|nr:ABC transporter permease [Candidatus Coprenecus stercoripullorum]